MSEQKKHQPYIDRIGSQQYLARCYCGWKGTQQNGKPFWNRGGAFGAIIGHAADLGLDLSTPIVIDSAPSVRRGNRVKGDA